MLISHLGKDPEACHSIPEGDQSKDFDKEYQESKLHFSGINHSNILFWKKETIG